MRENNALRDRLLALSDPNYRAFSAGLLPNVPKERILGVRLRCSGQCQRTRGGDWREYLRTASDASFEEVLLQG